MKLPHFQKKFALTKFLAMSLGLAVLPPLGSSSAFADSGTWNVNAAGNWSTTTNWTNSTVPGTAAGDVVGLNNNISATRTITIDTTSRTVGTLNIGDPSASYFGFTLAASGGAKLTFDNSGSGALLAKTTSGNTATDVISAPLILADNLTVNMTDTTAGSALQLGGVISDNGGARSITKIGGGILQMGTPSTGAGPINTFSGGFTLNEGEVQVSGNSVLGTGTLTVNSGTISARGAGRTLNNAVVVGGDFTLGGTAQGGNLLTLSGAVDLGGSTRTISVGATPGSAISGIISNGGITKSGAGTLTLSGPNTYSGNTRVASGTLALGNSGALQSSTLDINASDAGTLSFGTLTSATFGGLTGSRNIVLSNGSLAAVAVAIGGNGQSTTYSGVLSGVGSLTKAGTGVLTISATNTYTGATTISAGTLQVGNGTTDGSIAASSNIVNNGSLVYNLVGSQAYGNAISGSGSLSKSGSGTLILAGANAYAGTTTVNAGELVVNGSIIGSVTTVNSGGTLSGTGTTGSVTLAGGGTVSPGNSIGTLSVNGDFTLASTAALNFELQSGDVTLGNNINDLIAVNGNLTLGGTFSITELGGSLVDGSTYTLLTYSGTLDTTTDTWSLDQAFLALHPGSTIDTAVGGEVNLQVVPEPGTGLIFLSGAGLLGLLRRKQRRQA